MIILALDQSSQVSGYSVFNNDILIKSGVFSITGELPSRLIKIRKQVEKLIQEYHPDKVILEDIQLEEKQVNNVRTFKALAQVLGVLSMYLTENKIDYEIVLASTWRSKLGIKGKERSVYKKNTQLYVQKKYNKNVSEDEADAIAIGTYGIMDLKNYGYNWGEDD